MQKIKLNIGNDYESKYAVKDKQDSLAMCALQILSQSKNFINSDDEQSIEIGDKIEKLKNLIELRLNNENVH